jgi:hypothetical protein
MAFSRHLRAFGGISILAILVVLGNALVALLSAVLALL